MQTIQERQRAHKQVPEPFLIDEAAIRGYHEFLGFLNTQRDLFSPRTGRPEDTNFPLDGVARPLGRYVNRRTVLKAGMGLAATVAGIDQGGRLPELLAAEPPEVIFDSDQDRFLKGAKTAVLVIGPTTIQDPGKFEVATNLKHPFNEKNLPFGYLKYPSYGLDPKATAAALEQMKKQYGIENVIAVFESAGFQYVAQAFDILGDKLKLIHGMLDATPLDAHTIRTPFLGKIAQAIDPFYGGGLLVSSFANYQIYGDAFRGGTAGPDLAFDQAIGLVHGAELARLYRARIDRDGTTFAYLTTTDPLSDEVIDPVASRSGLERALNVPIPRYEIKGKKQHHANIYENPQGYHDAIGEIFRDGLIRIP